VRLDTGILFIVVISIIAIVYSYRTVHGYHTRLIGLSPDFAWAVGLPVARLTLQTLAMSGAVAGLTGAIAVFGIHHRYVDGMLVQPLYAWKGIIAVLLIGTIPWLVPFSSLFFAALETGAAGMERAAQVPKEIALIMQAVIILFFASRVSAALMSPPKADKGGDDA
jgi:simple sugar transport system permease protein